MAIDIPYLKSVAKNFLDVLNRERINSVADVVSKLGGRFPAKEQLEDYVEIRLREFRKDLPPSYKLSYVALGRGILIEVSINRILKYIQFIVKANKHVDGYELFPLPYVGDGVGNLRQSQKFNSIDFAVVENELERLSKLEDLDVGS